MSQIAPIDPAEPITAAEYAADVRGALARIAAGGGVTSCTGLDSDTEAALYRYMLDRTPHALAEVYAAADARIAGHR